MTRRLFAIAALLASLMLSACVSSKLVIGPLYNRLDNRLLNEFGKLTDFTDPQTAAFAERVAVFHRWHRVVELPRYAALLNDIGASVLNDTATREQVDTWFDRSYQLSLAFRQCHPANYSADLVQNLSPEQLDDIRRRLKRRMQKARLKYIAETPEARVERRVETLLKWSGRINLDWRPDQEAMMRDMLEQQTSLRARYYGVAEAWLGQLYLYAAREPTADNRRTIETHIGRFWTLLETFFPEPWNTNRLLWKATAADLAASLDDQQRRRLGNWLINFAGTLQSIADDTPTPAAEFSEPQAALGCAIPEPG